MRPTRACREPAASRSRRFALCGTRQHLDFTLVDDGSERIAGPAALSAEHHPRAFILVSRRHEAGDNFAALRDRDRLTALTHPINEREAFGLELGCRNRVAHMTSLDDLVMDGSTAEAVRRGITAPSGRGRYASAGNWSGAMAAAPAIV